MTGWAGEHGADVGGTTTDVGVLVNGLPRESSQGVEIGGIRTNFRMPDLVTIALGGGPVVSGALGQTLPGGERGVRLGPETVGYPRGGEALVFGGVPPTAAHTRGPAARAGPW